MLLLVGNIYVFVEDFSKPQVCSLVRYLKTEKETNIDSERFQSRAFVPGGTSCKCGSFCWAKTPIIIRELQYFKKFCLSEIAFFFFFLIQIKLKSVLGFIFVSLAFEFCQNKPLAKALSDFREHRGLMSLQWRLSR